MRTAVLAVTGKGAELAVRTVRGLDGENAVFLKQGIRFPGGGEIHGKVHYFDGLKEIVGKVFSQYDALIFIMAAGIVVRMIAPHIVSKLSDPAVVVMDERGIHAISLLSGHVGGGNALARRLAENLGAEAVITTATDVEQKLAPDVFASELALRPRPKDSIRILNSYLLSGGKVRYFIDRELPNAEFYLREAEQRGLDAGLTVPEEIPGDGIPKVVVTDRPLEGDKVLYLIPRRLIAGVGCRRGIGAEEIEAALQQACARIGRVPEDISLFASTMVKKEEPGLLQAVQRLQKRIEFHGNDVLEKVIQRFGLGESDFVKKTIGVGNVCEAAALASVEDGRIALGKMKFGKVTVALVWEK